MSAERATGRIKIIKVPEGEAPVSVREAWVGLTLPCNSNPTCGFNAETGNHDLFGVVSNSPVAGYSGFDVPEDLALNELAKVSPAAAQWWRDQGYPRHYGGYFHFGRSDAEAVSGITAMSVADEMETGRWEVPGAR